MQGLEESSPLGWGGCLGSLVLQDLKGLGDLLHPKGPLGGEEDVQGAPVPLRGLAAEEALPLIRYRTRDICSLTHEKCACGRTTVRMTKPKGRTDDMLIIRGINVFPSQIESVLLDLGMDPNYRMIVDRKNNLDTLEVQVEMNESMFSDTVRSLERVERTIADALHSTLNIAAKITLLEPKSIERSEGKAKRVIDRRKL